MLFKTKLLKNILLLALSDIFSFGLFLQLKSSMSENLPARSLQGPSAITIAIVIFIITWVGFWVSLGSSSGFGPGPPLFRVLFWVFWSSLFSSGSPSGVGSSARRSSPGLLCSLSSFVLLVFVLLLCFTLFLSVLRCISFCPISFNFCIYI